MKIKNVGSWLRSKFRFANQAQCNPAPTENENATEKVAPREFAPVFNRIVELLGGPTSELGKKLLLKAEYWAPEILWYKLSEFVNTNVPPSSSDEMSLSVYATLCGVTTDQMRERFIANGQ